MRPVLQRLTLCIAAIPVLLILLSACSQNAPGSRPVALALSVQYSEPGTSAKLHSASLEQLHFRLILAHEAELLRSQATRARLAEDFHSKLPLSGATAEYLGSSFNVGPGAAASASFEGLHPDARYLILVTAHPQDEPAAAGGLLYGYTRVNTRAGQTTNALVRLVPSAAQLAAHLAEWYGIEIIVETADETEDETEDETPGAEQLNLTIELVGFELVVNLGGQEAVLDRLLNETMTVTVMPPAGVEFVSYEWLLNGEENYPNTEPFNTGASSVTVESAEASLPLGTHTVSLIVTDADNVPYSTQFTFTIVEGL